MGSKKIEQENNVQDPSENFKADVNRFLAAARKSCVTVATAALKSSDDAEDAVQESFLEFFRDASGVTKNEWARYLHGILNHRVTDVIRKRMQDCGVFSDGAQPDEVEGVEDPQQDVEGAVEYNQVIEGVKACKYDLTPNQSSAFLEVVIYGNTFEEAAEQLHCTVEAVKDRVFRARAKLQEALK